MGGVTSGVQSDIDLSVYPTQGKGLDCAKGYSCQSGSPCDSSCDRLTFFEFWPNPNANADRIQLTLIAIVPIFAPYLALLCLSSAPYLSSSAVSQRPITDCLRSP